MLAKSKLYELGRKIGEATSVLIVTHEKPDGDAIGSACGLYLLLRERGQKVDVLLPDALPDKFLSLIPAGFTKEASASDYELVVLLDCANSSRVAGLDTDELPVDKAINIDHHLNNNMQRFDGFVGDAAATAQLVYEMAAESGWTITPEVANMLYLGIVTDTGSFRFTNTGSATFLAAANLLVAGANIEKINNAAFFSKSCRQQRFESEMIGCYAKMAFDDQFYYALIPESLFKKYDFSMKDGETVIELLREISGVVIAGLVYENNNGIKISLRSKDAQFPVGPIARELGGGGHEMASGIKMPGATLEEAEKLLLNKVGKMLRKEF